MSLGAALIILLAGASPSAKRLPPGDPLADIVEVKGMERWKKILLENEHKQLWKQIHWLTPPEAQQAAKENRKPVLLVIKTGSKGKAKAPFT